MNGVSRNYDYCYLKSCIIFIFYLNDYDLFKSQSMKKLKRDPLLFAYYREEKYLVSSKIIGKKYKKLNQFVV